METKKKVPMREKVLRIFIALGIAVLLWFMVNGNSDLIISQDFNSIPITITNAEGLAAKNLVLAEDKSYYLNLRVKGTDKNLRKINSKEITAEVNLSDINTKGTHDLEIVVKGLSNLNDHCNNDEKSIYHFTERLIWCIIKGNLKKRTAIWKSYYYIYNRE